MNTSDVLWQPDGEKHKTLFCFIPKGPSHWLIKSWGSFQDLCVGFSCVLRAKWKCRSKMVLNMHTVSQAGLWWFTSWWHQGPEWWCQWWECIHAVRSSTLALFGCWEFEAGLATLSLGCNNDYDKVMGTTEHRRDTCEGCIMLTWHSCVLMTSFIQFVSHHCRSWHFPLTSPWRAKSRLSWTPLYLCSGLLQLNGNEELGLSCTK